MSDIINTDPISAALFLLVGFVLGLGGALLFKSVRAINARCLAEQVYQANENLRRESQSAMLSRIENIFGNLSLEALNKSSSEFLKLAGARLETERTLGSHELESKKDQIERQLQRMGAELEKVTGLVRSLEQERREKYGALDNQLKWSHEQTRILIEATQALKETLSNNQARGLWGERMAEDVLRLCGLQENINYLKQKSDDGGATRPDFTFLLPQDRCLNMDVKFPLSNYLRLLEAASDSERRQRQKEFLRDVRARIKEITARNYIDPSRKTLDFALLFIPNEQIYAFMHEQDAALFEDAMRSKVLLCSPLSLFAVLAVIRQATDNFTLEQASTEILALMGAFKRQWDAFCAKMQLLGKKIAESQQEFETLLSTRRRQLEKPLNRIEQLRADLLGPAAAIDPSQAEEDESVPGSTPPRGKS